MVCGHDITVATTAGYTIQFIAGEEQYVPPLAVPECLKVGARELKRYINVKATVPNTKHGNIKSHVNVIPQAEDVIEEEVMPEKASINDTPSRPNTRNERVYPEAEQRVRRGILSMLKDSQAKEWTAAGIPNTAALQKRVEDMSVTGAMRDAVWRKMEEAEEIPEDYAEMLGLQ